MLTNFNEQLSFLQQATKAICEPKEGKKRKRTNKGMPLEFGHLWTREGSNGYKAQHPEPWHGEPTERANDATPLHSRNLCIRNGTATESKRRLACRPHARPDMNNLSMASMQPRPMGRARDPRTTSGIFIECSTFRMSNKKWRRTLQDFPCLLIQN